MTHHAKPPHDFSVLMPLTQEAQQIASQFASEQPTQQKALQVYLNTLAVYMVNNYLRIMDIPTDLAAGDSWNPVVRLASDVADLWVSEVGRLECRPVQPSSLRSCHIPPETQDDRIGYVVVQINLEQQETTLLGFSATVTANELLITELQPFNQLLKHLQRRQPFITPINLSQWWRNSFEVGWQAVEAFLDAQTVSETLVQVAFRRDVDKDIRRAKPLKLGGQQPKQMVILVVTLTQRTTDSFDIRLQVFPQTGETYLPTDLKLAVLDELGATFFETQAGSSDRLIQTRSFSGQLGERFQVYVCLGENSIVEGFVI